MYEYYGSIIDIWGGDIMFQNNIGKVLGITLILLLAFNFFFLLYIYQTINETSRQLEESIIELNQKIYSFQHDEVLHTNTNEVIDFLQQEYSNYRHFADSDRQSFFNLVSIFFVALGVLVTGGTIVLYWIFGQTKSEVKENAEITIKSTIHGIEEEAKNKIKELVDPQMKELEEKYKELERFMDNQYLLRQSKVLILCPKDHKEEMEHLELRRIREIVDEAQMIDLDDFNEFENKIENQEVDIIVYRYEKVDRDTQEEKIRKYIQSLKDKDSNIPVVVYAKPGNIVDGEDGKIVDSYPFAVMANLPTTLTSNMISLLSVLSYIRR